MAKTSTATTPNTIETIKDPVTGNTYSRDTSIQGSTFAPVAVSPGTTTSSVVGNSGINTKGGTLPSPTTPLDPTKLNGSSSVDVNKILAASLSGNTTSSDIAGLLSLYDTSTKEQDNYDNLTKELISTMSKFDNKSEDFDTALNKYGVPELNSELKQSNLSIARLKGELEKFDAESVAQNSNIAQRQAPLTSIQSQQSEVQRERNLTRLSKASELSAEIALNQAYQGNIQIATQQAEQSVDLKYKPYENELKILETQLQIAERSMDKADQKKATQISTLLSFAKESLDTQKQQEKDIQNLAVEAASNGAPLSVVTQIRNASDVATAASFGSFYIKGNLESIARSSGGGSSSGSVLTQAKKNTGAANAGISIADFDTLPIDDQNYFANAYSGFNSSISQVLSEKATAQDLADAIDTAPLSERSKEILRARARAKGIQFNNSASSDQEDSSSGFFSKAASIGWSTVKNLFGL